MEASEIGSQTISAMDKLGNGEIRAYLSSYSDLKVTYQGQTPERERESARE